MTFSSGDPIEKEAIGYVRANVREIIKSVVGSAEPSTSLPLSLFMAGSPGAGKTEFSTRIIPLFEEGMGEKIVRIDPDDLRAMMPGYKGNNSHIFQPATSIGVEKIHDYVIKHNINFLLDGTFSNSAKAHANIQRSVNHKRIVRVFYVFLEPKVAWDFTLKREALEGRRISKEVFVDHLFNSYKTVDSLKEAFGDKITLYLIDKKSITDANDFTLTEVKTKISDHQTINHDKNFLLNTL